MSEPEVKILIVDDNPNIRQALHGKTNADVVEFSAGVEGNYPLQVVRFPDVEENGSLHFTAGGPAGTRDVNTTLLAGLSPGLAAAVASWTNRRGSDLTLQLAFGRAAVFRP